MERPIILSTQLIPMKLKLLIEERQPKVKIIQEPLTIPVLRQLTQPTKKQNKTMRKILSTKRMIPIDEAMIEEKMMDEVMIDQITTEIVTIEVKTMTDLKTHHEKTMTQMITQMMTQPITLIVLILQTTHEIIHEIILTRKMTPIPIHRHQRGMVIIQVYRDHEHGYDQIRCKMTTQHKIKITETIRKNQ